MRAVDMSGEMIPAETLRTIFMGTSDFAVAALKGLIDCERTDVRAVFTRPDAVSGRGKKLLPSPVKVAAQEAGIEVFTPRDMRGSDVYDAVASISPDLIIVASYGCILPQEILDLPAIGCINIHASILPEHRGAAPIQRAILEGDEFAGVSLMLMTAGLDEGDFCAVARTEIGEKDYDALSAELAEMGAKLLIDNIDAISSGEAAWVAQDKTCATYAEKISKAEMLLSPELSAHDNLLRVRASSAQAPAKAVICGRPLTILAASAPEADAELPELAPGAATLFRKKLYLACSDGLLQILRVKPDGKKEMDAAAFCAGINAALKDGQSTWSAIA